MKKIDLRQTVGILANIGVLAWLLGESDNCQS